MSPKKKKAEAEPRKLYKSQKDKMIDGVCAGVAAYFRADVTLVRVAWVLSMFAGGFGFWAYLAAIFIIPKNPEENDIADEERVKYHPGMIVGGGLILLGIFLLTDTWPVFISPFRFGHFFGGIGIYSFGDALPFLLLACGIGYLIYALKGKDQEIVNDDSEPSSAKSRSSRWTRDLSNKWVAGVISGIARVIDLDVTILRIVCIALALTTNTMFFALVYIGLWIAMPDENEGGGE